MQTSSLSFVLQKRLSRLFLVMLVVGLFCDLGFNNLAVVTAQILPTKSEVTKLGQSVGAESREGFLTIVNETYYLDSLDGTQSLPLKFEADVQTSLDQLQRRYLHKTVKVTGRTTPNRQGSFSFRASSLELAGAGVISQQAFETEAVTGTKSFVTILCRFKYNSTEPRAKSWFEGLMGSTYPGLNDYFKTVSHQRVNLNNSLVATTATGNWFELDQPRSYYVVNDEPDTTKLKNDCIAKANPSVNFTQFYGINLQFNAPLSTDIAGVGAIHNMTLDGTTRNWGVTWIGYDANNSGVMSQATYAHEIGHVFGLPHSANSQGDTYLNAYDVMGKAHVGCLQGKTSSYGCTAQYPNAYHTALLGWYPSGRYALLNSAFADTTVTYYLFHPRYTDPGIYAIKIVNPNAAPTDPEITLELRLRASGSYDDVLPVQGLVIHRVYPNQSNPSRLLVSGGNPDDVLNPDAVWVPGEYFMTSYVNGDLLTVSVLGYNSTEGYYRISITRQHSVTT